MKEKNVSVTDVFDDLKRTATSFGATGTDFKFEDDEWIYTLSVKRKKQKR